MALDDRERNFEKALAQQLRADGGAGLVCPDAETLAAYHERMLSAEEMGSLKSHIAACPSCQEVLSTLEVTEAIPVGEEDSEKTLAGRALVSLSAVHAAPMFSKPADLAAPAKSSAVREISKPYRKWVVPAGAIAAGLLIWVTMNESWNRPKLTKQSVPAVEIAQNDKELRQSEVMVPSAADKRAEQQAKPAEKTLAAENERAKQSSDRTELDLESGKLGRTRANSANAYPHGPTMMQNQAQNQIQNNGNLNQSQAYEFRGQNQQSATTVAPRANAPVRSETKSQVAAAAPPPAPTAANGPGDGVDRKDAPVGSVSETVEISGAPAVSPDKNKEEITAREADKLAANGRSYQDLQKVGGIAGTAPATAAKEKKAAEAGRKQSKKADTGLIAGAMTSRTLRDVDEFRLSVVRTKDAKVFWVISQEGEVFRSEDGGKSSRKQEIGAGIKAIAGSATDAKIFWILADKEIVVRTADGGQHWATANVPAGLPFATITALDATHAIVSDVSGKISYSTSDGGTTWNVMVH